VPLVLLAIPSIVIGGIWIGPMLAGHFFDGAILVNLEKHPAMEHVAEEAANAVHMGWQAFTSPPLWLAAAGVFLAWLFYIRKPQWPDAIAARLKPLQRLLENKYFFDWINENIIARAARMLGSLLWTAGDKVIIDGAAVNGSAMTVGWLASVVRRVQTGFLYTYAFWMVIGLALLLGWFLVGKH
jgi:NADH-quinone oxidoreductase subunit L